MTDGMPPPAPLSDESVPRRLARGDEATAALVRDRIGRILSFKGYGIPAEDRRDIQQEVLTQVWQAVRQPAFDMTLGFWGFVETVATRRCIDWLRASRPTITLDTEIPAPEAGTLDALLAREDARLAYEALSRLDRGCRELVYLHAVLQKPYAQIAALLGASEGSLRVRLHRCVKQAREIIRASLHRPGEQS